MMNNRHIPDDTIIIERNGSVFLVHKRLRYAPLVVAAVGVGLQVASTIEQGEEQEKISKQRAAVDLRNAEAVEEASVEEAKIRSERGRRILATQRSQAAAGGVRINVGSPLVIEADTRAAITKDISFGLERGRAGVTGFESSADIERRLGKTAKRRSSFEAVSRGIQGFGSIARMRSNA